ncbi:conserved domain protein [delta proteobacterium NaphS2]|nr:conserved domain protein [delta proteobacterium NaphS2]
MNTIPTKKVSYLYLGTAFLLMVVSNWTYTISLAAWLYPVFLMRFMRLEKAAWGLLLGAAASIVAGIIMMWWTLSSEMLFPSSVRMLSGAAAGFLVFLPFAIDRLLTQRIGGFASTFLFPMAYTAMELAMSFDRHRSTWGSLAYTQYGNLPLLQLVSVTGIWGVTFLVAWFASVVNWAWSRGVGAPGVKRGLLLYVSVLAIVLLAGGARLTFFPPHGETTRVATITKPKRFHALFPLSESRESLCDNSDKEQAYFIAKTKEAARRGAGIILWQEVAVFIYREDEPAFLRKLQKVAREAGIYLGATVCSFPENYPESPWVVE